MIKRIIAIAGLPRSGTTLITSILGMQEGAVTCYEPWNQNTEQPPSPALTPEGLLQHFGLQIDEDATTLVIKETSGEFEALLWLQRFLQFNEPQLTIHTVWILRSYRHNYLSLIDTGREQWGNLDFHVNQQTYERYAKRVGRSTAAVAALCLTYPGVVFSYEKLVEAPQMVCEALCAGLDLIFTPAMLEFHDRMSTDHVHGDIEMATAPQAVSRAKVDSREAQWASVSAQFVGTHADAERSRLDAFWSRVNTLTCLCNQNRETTLKEAGLQAQYPANFAGASKDLRRPLKSRAEWMQLVQEHRRIVQPHAIDAQAQRVAAQGFHWEGQWARPDEISAKSDSYREGFVFDTLNSRQRAIISELWLDLNNRKRHPDDVSVYAPEYLSTFAAYFRERFPGFRGSEYFDSAEKQALFPEVPCEDLTDLSLASGSVDYALVNDVFEHMPDIGAGLRELSRVLTPNGVLLSTFPFAFKEDNGVLRSRLLDDGSVEHLLPPEYHGDPVDNEGVLVFKVPGWHILQECEKAGFTKASMVFLCKPSAGIVSEAVAGVFVLRAAKG